jgi:hypothetical protein
MGFAKSSTHPTCRSVANAASQSWGIPMQVAMIPFTDSESGDEAFASVRVEGGAAGLALSLRKNGDIEVFLARRDLEQLIEALQKAKAALPAT